MQQYSESPLITTPLVSFLSGLGPRGGRLSARWVAAGIDVWETDS